MIYARKFFRFKVNETNSHYFLYIQNKATEITKRIAPVKLMLSGGEEYC